MQRTPNGSSVPLRLTLNQWQHDTRSFFRFSPHTAISVLGYFMQTAAHFYALAALVGVVQGGTQALSRSLFASMIPPHKSGEFFGFWSVFEKFAGIFGPLIFAGTIAATGSSRNAILSVIGFFAVGAAILMFVDVEEGQRRSSSLPGRRYQTSHQTVLVCMKYPIDHFSIVAFVTRLLKSCWARSTSPML